MTNDGPDAACKSIEETPPPRDCRPPEWKRLFIGSLAIAIAAWSAWAIVQELETWKPARHGSVAVGQSPDGGSAVPASVDRFQPTVVVQSIFEPITEFPIVAAREADKQLNDAELVLGVTVAGEARAYPINMLTGPEREILNDTLGKRPIAATW